MKKNAKNFMGIGIWVLLVFISGNLGLIGRLIPHSSETKQVMEDLYMRTTAYSTDIKIQEDNSYLVTEDIQVFFMLPRHGIYRYVPQKGIITELKEDGTTKDIPYYASFGKITSSETLDVSSENGNKVLRMGDANRDVSGIQDYQLQYEVRPVTSTTYQNVYYNIFPTGWQNEIPSGSTFKITFPKKIQESQLQLYYGRYGERIDASNIVNLKWDGNTVSGELTDSLPVGTGMTFYVPMEKGYFQYGNTVWRINYLLIGISAVFLLILVLLFFFFGRDKEIISSVQFQPPNGLDSAAVGYIIDGNVSDTDTVSLILFWASKGYIKIRQGKNNSLIFVKMKNLPNDAPKYAQTFFNGIFGKSAPVMKTVKVSDLKYRMAKTFENVKKEIATDYSRHVYTTSSKVARKVAGILSVIPIFLLVFCIMQLSLVNPIVLCLPVLYTIGVVLFNRTVDYWYAKEQRSRAVKGSIALAMGITPIVALFLCYGIGMLRGSMLNLFPGFAATAIVSCAGLVITGFMKKRTDQCVEWMGYLVGLREFIETAELDRMKAIAEESPQLFYHILPFAYVFGLTDILLDKMKDLTLPEPEWYETVNGTGYFEYTMMRRMLCTDMKRAASTISTPKPSQSSGGSFSGGGSSGGGFSGGGFGGGGGGSW